VTTTAGSIKSFEGPHTAEALARASSKCLGEKNLKVRVKILRHLHSETIKLVVEIRSHRVVESQKHRVVNALGDPMQKELR
jgi:hypothetical protein